MKTSFVKRDVAVSGKGDESQFSIRATAKAFRILSDGLYAKKRLAVIRELACNAFDSHIAAGKKDVPFEVHLPNSLEPWLHVRDFGVGLSHEDVMTLYTTYFESTKTDTNDQIGALGLGSKSPFAYVNEFTVTSCFDGKQRQYVAFINENHEPTIKLLAESDTDEGNGLTVKVPVNDRDDFYRFKQDAQTALFRFSPQPTVVGTDDVEFILNKPNYILEGDGWKLRDGRATGSSTNAFAIQGNVAYPLDRYAIDDLTDNQLSVLCLNIDIFFDIGELEVAASREELGYDDRTKNNIKKRIDEIISDIPKRLGVRFKKCKTLWEAKLLWGKLINSLYLQEVVKIEGIKWRGHIIHDKYFKIKMTGKTDNDGNYTPSELEGLQIFQFEVPRRGRNVKGSRVTTDHRNEVSFGATNSELYFFDDVGRGSHSRISHYFMTEARSNGISRIYLIKNKKDEFKTALGEVPIENVSMLPKPKRDNKGYNSSKVKVRRFDRAASRYSRDHHKWVDTNLDITDGGVYVVIKRFKPVGIHGSYPIHTFLNAVKALGLIENIDEMDIYGINPRWVNKLDKGHWTNLVDLVKDRLCNLIKDKKIIEILANQASAKRVPAYYSHLFDAVDKNSGLSDSSPFSNFIKTYNKIVKTEIDINLDKVRELALMIDINFEIGDPNKTIDFSSKLEELLAMYPMIELSDTWRLTYDENVQTVVDYINLIDSASE